MKGTLVEVAPQSLPGLVEGRDLDSIRRPSSGLGGWANLANSSELRPEATRSAQRSSSDRSSRRCASTSVTRPKWVSARHSGRRRSTSSMVACRKLDVDIRRWRHGEDGAAGLGPDAARVAGEQDAVPDVADVVRGVTWRGERLPSEYVSLGEADAVLRHGGQLPVQLVESLAVEAAGRGLEPRGIGQVARPDRRDPDTQAWMLAH